MEEKEKQKSYEETLIDVQKTIIKGLNKAIEKTSESQWSEEINELAEAMAKMQGELPIAKAESDNFYGSKYADLAACINAARKPLSENGLSVIQLTIPEIDVKKVTVRTILLHKSGQWIKSQLSLMCKTDDPQERTSLITYSRRYQYNAIIGLAQEDTDGEDKKRKKNGSLMPKETEQNSKPEAVKSKRNKKTEPKKEGDKNA